MTPIFIGLFQTSFLSPQISFLYTYQASLLRNAIAMASQTESIIFYNDPTPYPHDASPEFIL